MRILQVTLGFFPAQNWGGPVRIVYENSKELVRRGHQVTVYCTNLLNKAQKIQPGTFERQVDGIRVVYMNTYNLPWWPGTLGPIWLPDMRRYLQQEIRQFDVVHLNGYRSPLILLPARAARRAGIPVVMQPHGTLQVIMNTFFLKRVYDRLLGNQELDDLGALIALQESERRQALAYGVPAERIEIISNGIDAVDLEGLPVKGDFRKRYNIPSDKRMILFLGRVNKKKGTDMLVEAFARRADPDAHLVIAGPDDGQMADVKALVTSHRLETRVTLTGLLTGKDVYAAFHDADLFVLPCRTDTFPTTIMEACLMGTPMVITDRCENAHLVKGRVADVVSYDPQVFAQAMQALLADQVRYQQYQDNCRVVLHDTFSIHHVVDLLEGVYQRLIAENAQKE